MKFARILAFTCLGFVAQFTLAQANEQTFAKPKQGSLRIDYCLVFGGACGKPAADKFCQDKGFAQSIDQVEDVDIGASGIATIVQGSGQICNQPICDGFTYITCQKPDSAPPVPGPLPPPSPGGGGGDMHTYYHPKLGGMRLNLCVSKGSECNGQSAADEYCSNKGFDDASDFTSTGRLPPFAKSRYIGNGKLCKGRNCKAFSDITCENTP